MDWKIFVSVINDKIDITYVHVLHCRTVDISNTEITYNIKIPQFRVVSLLVISEPCKLLGDCTML